MQHTVLLVDAVKCICGTLRCTFVSVCVSVAESHCDRAGQTGVLPPQPSHSGTMSAIVAVTRGSSSVLQHIYNKLLNREKVQLPELLDCVIFVSDIEQNF